MALRSFAGLTPMPIDKSQCFILSRVLLYVDRLLGCHPNLDFEVLETIYWLVGPKIVEEDLLPLATMLDTGERQGPFGRTLPEEIRHSRDFAHVVDTALRSASRGEEICVADLLKSLLKKRQDQLQFSGGSDIKRNLDTFQQMFGLSNLERDIYLFFLTLSVYEEAQSLFQYHLRCDRYAGRNYLAAVLNSDPSEISRSLNGKLSQIGILVPDREGVCLELDFLHFLQNASEADINTEFFKKIEPDTLPLDAHTIEREVTEHALRLLSPENERGCSIILFGNPGVGKTTYAYGLGKELGLDIYLCKHEGKDKTLETPGGGHGVREHGRPELKTRC